MPQPDRGSCFHCAATGALRGSVRDVVAAIQLSRATVRNVRQNLLCAFIYNAAGIPVAAGLLFVFGGPLLSPMFAAAAMALSSVSVVSNALRLRRFKPSIDMLTGDDTKPPLTDPFPA